MSRRLLVSLVLLAVATSLLSGLWYWGTGLMLARLDDWAQARRAEGIAVSWQKIERDGFPLTIAGRITAPAITHPLGWRWSGAALRTETTLARLDRYALQALGEQRLSWPGMPETQTPASLIAREARGEVSFGFDGQAEWLEITLKDWKAKGPFKGGEMAGDGSEIRIERADDDLGYPEGALGSTEVRVRRLVLPPEMEAPLGNEVALLDLQAVLTGKSGDLKATPREILAKWRDTGGTLDVTQLALDWGPLTVKGDGRVTLDEEFRPLGAFSLKVKGLGKTLDLLARKGLIEGSAAFALQAGSLALGKVDPEDGRSEIQLPLTLQNGWLSLGPLQILKLKPLPLPE